MGNTGRGSVWGNRDSGSSGTESRPRGGRGGVGVGVAGGVESSGDGAVVGW